MFCGVNSNVLSLFFYQHKPQPSTTTFVLNQLNQLPPLGAVVTKQPAINPVKHTITVTKVVHVANSTLRSSLAPSSTSIPPSASTVVPSNRDQVSLCSSYFQWINSLVSGKAFYLVMVIILISADSVERPPSAQQCEEHWSKGQQSDRAHEAQAST